MKRLYELIVVGVTAGGLISSSAWAHAVLKSAAPAAGVALNAAPKEIVLRFNEKLEASFSAIKVTNSSGRDLGAAKAQVDAVDPATLKLALPNLAPGVYGVHWRAVGRDGHLRKGDYTFTVK
jgi:hypothetical protein